MIKDLSLLILALSWQSACGLRPIMAVKVVIYGQ
jgi:hypothetical protein